jgi:hypothetical protein
MKALYKDSRYWNADTLYLNFASGYRPILGFYPCIACISRRINPKTRQYFSSTHEQAPPIHAITVLDFADGKLCSAIIRGNRFP